MATTDSITTAEQLLAAGDLGRCELVRGELFIMPPRGEEHGELVVNVTGPLYVFLQQNPLGKLYGAEAGFLIARDPDTVRAPDVAFVRGDRAAGRKGKRRGFFHGPPDLAVEVLSPDDRATRVLAKVHDWLAAGCQVVWIVDPDTRSISVYDRERPVVVLSEADILTAEELLPGFQLPVAAIFAA